MQSRLVLLSLLVFWAGCSSASGEHGKKPVKPGVCPKRAPPGNTDPCKAKCVTDACCPGKAKCCKISCGNACLMPLHGGLESLNVNPTAAGPTRGPLRTVTAPRGATPPPSMADNLELMAKPSFPPKMKPGVCPTIPPKGVDHSKTCSHDSQCPGNQKCCSIHGRNTCMPPRSGVPPKKKPGVCPTIPPKGVDHSKTCNDDSDCRGNQKCCRFHGRNSCSPPRPGGPVVKPGVCPTKPPQGVTHACTSPCKHDSECPGNQKCCRIHCGNTCLAPRHA